MLDPKNKIFRLVGDTADDMARECYVVGGFVRDLLLRRPSKDIDFVTVGSGIELASEVASRLGRGAHLTVFRNYGTAQVKWHKTELEFVGARKESYRKESRNPIVEDGTLDDDLSRRDFTINAMAISVNAATFDTLIDKFNGLEDLHNGIIRTPLDPDITFSDDPLRMMRAVRFATQLQFSICEPTAEAIARNATRLEIISRERIADELMKIMRSPRPSIGWKLMSDLGLLRIVLPELQALRGVEVVNGRAHKDNFFHTMEVLDKVAAQSDNVWLRWSALLHDIGKPPTKQWDDQAGWTFKNHNFVGSKMIPRIFRNLKLPVGDNMRYVAKLVELHMRPIALVEEIVTDSAVRRLINQGAEDLDDLMLLCSADITSKNPETVRRHLENFEKVKEKMIILEERDHIRNYQPPVDGTEIMRVLGLPQGREVGVIKQRIKDAILDGEIPNDHDSAYNYMLSVAAELGLTPVADNESQISDDSSCTTSQNA